MQKSNLYVAHKNGIEGDLSAIKAKMYLEFKK